jgi:peptidoglycan/LPS O-acetylase OafA/YrhL
MVETSEVPGKVALEYAAVPAARQTPADALRLDGHVPALDGLRGVAIILVLLRHLTPQGEGHSAIGNVVRAVAGIGGTGVDLFFVLSGFLITGILLDAKGTKHFFRNFYARRTLRIFPLYYGVLLVCFVIVPLIHPFGEGERKVAQLQGWLWLYGANIRESFVGAGYPFSGGWISMDHFWSLAVEEHFYLVWPLLVWLCSRRVMIGVCVGMMVAALGLRCWLFWNAESMAFYHLTPCRMDELAMGGLLALLARENGAVRWMAKGAWVAFAISFAVLIATWKKDWNEEVLRSSLLAVTFAALLVIVVTCGARNPIKVVMNRRGMRLMGKYSYATYVLHPLLIHAVLVRWLPYQKLAEAFHSGVMGVCVYLVLGFVMSIAAAWASWHVYEKHFLRLKRFFDYHGASEKGG